MLDSQRLDFTTTAGGAASGTTVNLNGKLYGFALILGTATSLDLTIDNAEGITLFSDTGLNADAPHLPRFAVETNLGAAIVYGAGNPVSEPVPVVGPLTLTIANGGVTKTASVILYIER